VKTTISIQRGGQWFEWATFIDVAVPDAVREVTRARQAKYDAERAEAIKRNESKRETRVHAQKVALARNEVPPADVDVTELEVVPVEKTLPVLTVWDPADFCREVTPGSPAHLIGVTALSMVVNKWADRAVIEVELGP
jgi:hypothetical protein